MSQNVIKLIDQYIEICREQREIATRNNQKDQEIDATTRIATAADIQLFILKGSAQKGNPDELLQRALMNKKS